MERGLEQISNYRDIMVFIDREKLNHSLLQILNKDDAVKIYEKVREYGNYDYNNCDAYTNISQFILDIFGFENLILDNRLIRPERKILWEIYNKTNILKPFVEERDEFHIFKNNDFSLRFWTLRYWKINKEKILKILKEDSNEPASEESVESDVYFNLPSNAWKMSINQYI